MIDNPTPQNWKDLQNGVCRLFSDIGLLAETEKVLQTPRGTVEVDVFAIDENSVDKIQYLVECKNWSNSIPQTVVHSFTTVMQETGANIGFIVSKKGLQEGAFRYTQNTNITGITYLELQQRYFNVWWQKHFCPTVAEAADYVNQYVEPINSRRSRYLEKLTNDQQKHFYELQNRYAAFGMLMWLMDMGRIAPQYATDGPVCIEEYKAKFVETMGSEFSFQSNSYRELLIEFCKMLQRIEEQFHGVFGRNIFKET
ncbi:restriction endonuclease [Pseudoalteromonas sp. OFAV1]|uniref:restriction endonuclease n=1 Tax=Pseudoalteromonas sp. OFAV1 TaxID=2908892 RepID=UPI001F246F88|nr:restriction endonuclease [Pseudoalteromonas sp. OFAV1]MCF2903027.1 restriction endonuclease [Pseudoalteromonas sp. OFAV1]